MYSEDHRCTYGLSKQRGGEFKFLKLWTKQKLHLSFFCVLDAGYSDFFMIEKPLMIASRWIHCDYQSPEADGG